MAVFWSPLGKKMQMKPRSNCGLLSWKGLGMFNKSNHGATRAGLVPIQRSLWWIMWILLFSGQPRAERKTHIWLVHHHPALMPCSLFIGWLSSVPYTFSVWIMWHPGGNPLWPLNHHIGRPSNPFRNVMFATWHALSVVPGGNIIHFYLLIYLFFLFRNWPLVAGVPSEGCCGFLAVNIWPGTERTCCRSKVRDLMFCHCGYFRASLDIRVVTRGAASAQSGQMLRDISSENEIQYEHHKVGCR